MTPMVKWLYLLTLVTFSTQECFYSNGKYTCEKIPVLNILYQFYSKIDLNQTVTSIEIVGTDYNEIEHFLYPLQEGRGKNITEIKISQCGVKTVRDNAFKSFTNLQVLDLSNNRIKNISFVKDLPNELKKLYLNGNDIESVENVFTNLKHLKYVDLSSCNIKNNLDLAVFNDVIKLELVNISNNNMNTSDNSKLVSNIYCVDLSYNNLVDFKNIPIYCHDVSFTSYTKMSMNNFRYDNNSIFVDKLVEKGNTNVGLEATDRNKKLMPIEIRHLDISYTKYGIKKLANLVKVKILSELILKNSHIPVLNKSIYNLIDLFHNQSHQVKLDLSNCSVADINEFYFENYVLGTLNLSGNNIKKLEHNTFHNAQILVLDLSYSNIEVIETLAFDGLFCESLNLSKNELSSISFKNVKSIKELDLSFNKLLTFNFEPFVESKNIKLLDLSHNLLTSLDNNSLSSFEKITVLHLENNKLINIEGLFLYTLKIDSLFISYNDKMLVDTFKNPNNYLKSLTVLDLESKEFQKDYVLGLNNLEKIHFINTNVQVLPAGSLNGLFSLQFLDSQNLFKHTTILKKHTFKDLKELIVLDLSSLSLEIIEGESFVGLNKLHKLNLTSNKIKHLSSKTFAGLENLKGLFIGNNKLTTIPLGTFMNLRLLERLDMSNNSITQLDTGVFSKLHNLVYLNLSHNKLQTISPHVLFPLKNLDELYIDGNYLITLDYQNILDDLSYLSMVGIGDNKWNCKILYLMLKLFESKKISIYPTHGANNYTTTNINGVSCTYDYNSDVDNVVAQ